MSEIYSITGQRSLNASPALKKSVKSTNKSNPGLRSTPPPPSNNRFNPSPARINSHILDSGSGTNGDVGHTWPCNTFSRAKSPPARVIHSKLGSKSTAPPRPKTAGPREREPEINTFSTYPAESVEEPPEDDLDEDTPEWTGPELIVGGCDFHEQLLLIIKLESAIREHEDAKRALQELAVEAKLVPSLKQRFSEMHTQIESYSRGERPSPLSFDPNNLFADLPEGNDNTNSSKSINNGNNQNNGAAAKEVPHSKKTTVSAAVADKKGVASDKSDKVVASRLVEVADQLAEAKTALEQKNKLIEQHKLTIAELQEHQYRPGEREFLNGKLLRRKAQVKELKELCAATARELSQRSAAEAKAAADLAELTAKHLQVRQTLENTMANLRDTKSAEDALEMKLMEAKQNHGQLSVMYGQMASTLKSQSQQIKEKNTIVSNLTLAHDKLESEHKDFSVSMLEIMNQNQTLVSQNAALVAENNTLSWRHKMLSANFKSLKEQHRRVFQEHDQATKQLHSVNKSLVNKTKMHSKAVSELSETKRKLQTSVEELEAVATKLTDSAQVQAALEARQSELTAQVTALTAEHTNALAQVTDLKALYSQAAELLEQAQRERVASDEGAAEAKRQHKSLAAVLSQTQTQLDEEKTKTELAHAALAELKSSHDLMQAALSDLTAQHDGACHHKRELERVTRELAENATQLKDSTDLLGLLAEEKLRLETAQADLHGVVGLQTTQLASARQAREALESQMKGLSERHSKAKQELRLAKRHVEQVASDAEQAGLAVDGLQRELSEKQTQLEKLEAQNQSLQAALDDVRQKYEVMSRQHGELTAQFHHESKLFEETKSEHDKLASHSETLANQLVECKRETAELRTELKAAENQLKSLGMQAGVSSTSKVNGALTKSHSPSVQRALTVAGNGSKPLADRGTAKLHTGSPANLGKDGVKDLTRRASPSNRAGSPKVTFKLLSKDGNSPENPEAAAEEIDTNNSNAAVAIAEGLLMVPISPATNYLLKDTSRTNIIQKSTKQAGRSEPVNKAPSSSGGKEISLKAREPREHAGNSKPGSNSSASHARALEAKVAALTQQLADAQATIAQLEIRVQRERQSFEALTMVHDMTTDTLKQTEAALEESKLQKSRLETELRELRLSLRGSTGKSGGVRGSAKR